MLNRSPPSQLVSAIRPRAAAQNAVAILLYLIIVYFFLVLIFYSYLKSEAYNWVYGTVQLVGVAGTAVC